MTQGDTPTVTEEHVATASRPSDLRNTDLRVANVAGVPFRSSIIRIDTNQGLAGYGEVRDQASATYALREGRRASGSYVDTVSSVVGYDIALAADHFGHIALDSCIRIGRALEEFTLAWIEDLIPWQLTDQ